MKKILEISSYKRVVQKFLFFPKNLLGEWHWFKKVKIIQSLGSKALFSGEENYIRYVWIDTEYCSDYKYKILKNEQKQNSNYINKRF